MQPAGHFVGVVVELAAGVELGHHNLRARAPLRVFRVQLRRYATPVVYDTDRIVRVNGDGDLVAIAGERLVHRVVDYFEHHVMQPGAVAGIADVHARTLAYCLQALEHLDTAGVVVVGRSLRFFLFFACLRCHSLFLWCEGYPRKRRFLVRSPR